jgi:hypothetical protein
MANVSDIEKGTKVIAPIGKGTVTKVEVAETGRRGRPATLFSVRVGNNTSQFKASDLKLA